MTDQQWRNGLFGGAEGTEPLLSCPLRNVEGTARSRCTPVLYTTGCTEGRGRQDRECTMPSAGRSTQVPATPAGLMDEPLWL